MNKRRLTVSDCPEHFTSHRSCVTIEVMRCGSRVLRYVQAFACPHHRAKNLNCTVKTIYLLNCELSREHINDKCVALYNK
jgi:hypothetical protein